MLKLSFYKLVQVLKTYISLEKIETWIMICSYTAQKWLSELKYEYKNLHKDMFMYKHI